MNNWKIAVARTPAKRKSKTWARDIAGDLSADDHMKNSTSESSIEKSGFQSVKQSCKCFNHSRLNCTTVLRAFHDHASM